MQPNFTPSQCLIDGILTLIGTLLSDATVERRDESRTPFPETIRLVPPSGRRQLDRSRQYFYQARLRTVAGNYRVFAKPEGGTGTGVWPANRNLLSGGRVRVVRYGIAADVDYGFDGGFIAGSYGSIGGEALGASFQAQGDVG